jgi:hypothetical protein
MLKLISLIRNFLGLNLEIYLLNLRDVYVWISTKNRYLLLII